MPVATLVKDFNPTRSTRFVFNAVQNLTQFALSADGRLRLRTSLSPGMLTDFEVRVTDNERHEVHSFVVEVFAKVCYS